MSHLELCYCSVLYWSRLSKLYILLHIRTFLAWLPVCLMIVHMLVAIYTIALLCPTRVSFMILSQMNYKHFHLGKWRRQNRMYAIKARMQNVFSRMSNGYRVIFIFRLWWWWRDGGWCTTFNFTLVALEIRFYFEWMRFVNDGRSITVQMKSEN